MASLGAGCRWHSLMSNTRSKRMGMWKPKRIAIHLSLRPRAGVAHVIPSTYSISSFVNQRLLQNEILQLVPVVRQARAMA